LRGPSLFTLLGERVRVRGKGAPEFHTMLLKTTSAVLFPLTPALSLGERGNGLAGVLQVSAGLDLRGPSLFPLLGERVRVRGKGSSEFHIIFLSSY
jgi:hypothetical protein